MKRDTRLRVINACTQPPMETWRTACATFSKLRLKYLPLKDYPGLRGSIHAFSVQQSPIRLGIPVDLHQPMHPAKPVWDVLHASRDAQCSDTMMALWPLVDDFD
jgi:hypothetical protein